MFVYTISIHHGEAATLYYLQRGQIDQPEDWETIRTFRTKGAADNALKVRARTYRGQRAYGMRHSGRACLLIQTSKVSRDSWGNYKPLRLPGYYDRIEEFGTGARRARLENKAEKREDWADKARAESARRHKSADDAFYQMNGQPILVGHHSEKRHRKQIDKAWNNIRRSAEASNLAEHHERAAATVTERLETSIYTDDPDAPEALRARIAENEALRERMKQINKALRAKKPTEPDPPLTESERRDLDVQARFGNSRKPGYPTYAIAGVGAKIATDRKRLEYIDRLAREQKATEDNGGMLIKHHGSDYSSIRFADKPARSILQDLRAAGFRWGNGAWSGATSKIPASVIALQSGPVPTPIQETGAAHLAEVLRDGHERIHPECTGGCPSLTIADDLDTAPTDETIAEALIELGQLDATPPYRRP